MDNVKLDTLIGWNRLSFSLAHPRVILSLEHDPTRECTRASSLDLYPCLLYPDLSKTNLFTFTLLSRNTKHICIVHFGKKLKKIFFYQTKIPERESNRRPSVSVNSSLFYCQYNHHYHLFRPNI